ncbi:MAG: ATP-binding protein [Lyngbya sp. HA4199-MV5]|jgi:tetratricopeptide (TPR) repeat protein|nr:ATP-binding protein [Lyngbya sp. HA4199-MV5]
MSTTDHSRQDVEAENERSLDTLLRAITLSQRQFALILVRCNYTRLRDRMAQQLKERCPFPLHEYTLPETAKTLYTKIRTEIEEEEEEGDRGQGTGDRGQGAGDRGQGAEGRRQEDLLLTTNNQQLTTSPTPHSPLPTPHSPPCCLPPNALMIYGLESVMAIDQVLVATNLVREELSKTFPFPLVLWMNDRVLAKLDRLAPDLKSWAGNTVISFEVAAEAVVEGLRQHTDRLFASILDAGDEQFLPNWALLQQNQFQTWGNNALRRTELEFALDRVLTSGQAIDPALQASLDFLLGQEAHAQGEWETARTCYEHSLAFWQEESDRQRSQKLSESFVLLPSASERAACVLIYLGLWWRSQAMQQRALYTNACQQAGTYFKRGLAVFEQTNRQDLVARFMIPQAEVLQKLQQWDELETLAKRALVLHKLYADPVRQARDHGFLAEVALSRGAWTEAKQQVETALDMLTATAEAIDHQAPNHHLEYSLEVAHRYHQGWYLLLLARAEAKLGQVEVAIAHLETAQHQTYPPDDPQLYIVILRHLRDLYFQQGRYLEAFHTKQTRRSLEHQYGFRAFIGALRLEPQQSLFSQMPGQLTPEAPLAQEIRASGRQQDVNRLVARMGRNDIKLTVIHGYSGVGKSSIVNAGLVPALNDRIIGDRIALPILIDFYTDWQTALEAKLVLALGGRGVEEGEWGVGSGESGVGSREAEGRGQEAEGRGQEAEGRGQEAEGRGQRAEGRRQEAVSSDRQNGEFNAPSASPASASPSAHPSPLTPHPLLLSLLRQATSLNFIPVLIFDQFEEFFFVHETLQQRRLFYEFLRDCLNLDFVKVVLTLRQDYLHHLLEFQRFARGDSVNLDSINDILGKDVRYPLGDFSPADARSIIKSLTDRAQFYLDNDLVEALVTDLARDTGEVRAIELQAVGAELQAEGITTLEEYRQKGPKEKLVARSLEDIVEDCGPENEDAAWNVLFLLTNENGTRPLKSREDLETDLVDLGLTAEINKLDLVLEVLVGSGLLFLVPENPADRYQLVHDYLVSFIRQQQEEGIAEVDGYDRHPSEESQPEPVVKRLISLRRQNAFLKSRLKHLRSAEILPSLLLLFSLVLLIATLAVSFKPTSDTPKQKRVEAGLGWHVLLPQLSPSVPNAVPKESQLR